MRSTVLTIMGAALLAGCSDYGHGPAYGSGPNRDWRRYDYSRPDPAYGGYYADRYYRDGSRYRERVLTRRDRVYRGMDDRYYCRRPDGSTGLVIGAAAGAVLGNVIARGDSRTLGTIIGATAGALLGRQIDRGEWRCR